jgi:hypothetical protein
MGDALVIAAASALAYLVRDVLGRVTAVQEFANEVPIALAVIPLWLVLFHLAGAYRPEYLNAGGDAFRRFVAGVAGGVFTLGFLSFALNLQLSRLFVVFLAVGVFLGGGGLRLRLRRALQRRQAAGELLSRTLVVGTDSDAQQLVAALSTNDDSSYRVVGYLDERAASGSDVDGTRVVGHPRDVLAACDEYGAGIVIVSPAGVSPGSLRDLTIALEGSPIDLAVAPSLFQVVTRRMTIETIGGVPILHVDQIRLERGKAILKRTVDLLAAAVLLLLSLPVWLVTSRSRSGRLGRTDALPAAARRARRASLHDAQVPDDGGGRRGPARRGRAPQRGRGALLQDHLGPARHPRRPGAAAVVGRRAAAAPQRAAG